MSSFAYFRIQCVRHWHAELMQRLHHAERRVVGAATAAQRAVTAVATALKTKVCVLCHHMLQCEMCESVIVIVCFSRYIYVRKMYLL